MTSTTFKDDEQLAALTLAANLEDQNKMLRIGVKGATHLIKRHRSDVAAFKRLLKPSAKTGHRDTLQRSLEASEWDLQSKVNERKQFRETIKHNRSLIAFIKKAFYLVDSNT